MVSPNPDPFLLGEWEGCLWRAFGRDPGRGDPKKMWAQGPALPLGEGKEKEQTHQGFAQGLAPQARAETWPVNGAEGKQAHWSILIINFLKFKF